MITGIDNNAIRISTTVPRRAESRDGSRNKARGFSLVELMIALVLGLLVIGAVISVFITNQQAFRTAENMARLQENARFAFEALAREMRESGGTPCGTTAVANVLNGGGGWWSWGNGPLIGYDGNQAGPQSFGSDPGQRVAGTDGVLVLTASLFEGVVITDHNANAAQFKVKMANQGIQDGDIVMACDSQSAAIFQVTNVTNTNQANVTIIVHNTGTGNPGNCSKGLGLPTVCTANGTPKSFASGGLIARYSASFWYIGNNSRGGRSLYRLGFTGAPSPQAQEIADGVTDMQIEYLTAAPGTPPTLANRYVAASAIADWDDVIAARVTLTMETGDRVGVDGNAIIRPFMHVISLRNREYVP
ncbi:MAG: PilW family protein [Halothiobacillaceae bacterium]